MAKGQIPQDIQKEYKTLEPTLHKVLAELRRIIVSQLAKVQDPGLVRVRLTEARVKSLGSLWKKARKNNWKQKSILKKAKDLIGFRIVCGNLSDIHRIKQLLISHPRINEIHGSEEDRTETSTPSGYRDFKFYVTYKIREPNYEATSEIQIRTGLQDSWAILTHKDIYKEGDYLRQPLKKLTYRLSELLHVSDEIAQDIRDQVSQRRKPPKRLGKLITENALRLLFKKHFGELPPDYIVRHVKNKCDELDVTHVKSLEDVFASAKHIERLKKTYKGVTGWDIYDELVFEISPLVAAFGMKVALGAMIKLARNEREEVDQIYRREIESELPKKYEDFLEYLEPHTKDDFSDFPERIYRLAEIFDALGHCSICGAPIVDEGVFAENAEEHYGKINVADQIETVVFNSGADLGVGSLCSYHAHVMGD